MAGYPVRTVSWLVYLSALEQSVEYDTALESTALPAGAGCRTKLLAVFGGCFTVPTELAENLQIGPS